MNVTLRIPDELGKRAKHFAVDEGKSLSAVVSELLEKQLQISERKGYRDSQRQAWALIEEGFSGGGQKFVRDEVYDR